MKKQTITFPKGIYHFNSIPNFDYQLNRVVMWNGGDAKEIKQIAGRINSSKTWKKELIGLGNQAIKENRIKEAIAYYRMSEFFMYDGDPDKKKYYQKAVDLFNVYYKGYFEEGIVKRFEVPYEGIKLPIMHVVPEGQKVDTLLLHGGNDSYFEELFFAMLYLREKGFEVYLFEGPGQGGVMRLQEKPFTYQWEKPVKAILDNFKLQNVTIMGASLGGMLAPRAAAFDERIQRIVAWSIFPNFLHVVLAGLSPAGQRSMKFLMKFKVKTLINLILYQIAKKDEEMKWGLAHGMYAYGVKSPYDYLMKLNDFQMLDVGPRITQDILVIGASEDHFIDYHLFKEELDALTQVRSLTFRLFTKAESASNHCNMGNTKLVLDTVSQWVKGLSER